MTVKEVQLNLLAVSTQVLIFNNPHVPVPEAQLALFNLASHTDYFPGSPGKQLQKEVIANMKYKTVLILYFLVCQPGCNQSGESQDQDQDQGPIKLTSSSPIQENVSLSVFNVFSSNNRHYAERDSSGNIFLEIPRIKAGIAHLQVPGISTKLYIMPYDTIHIALQSNNGQRFFHFTGNNDAQYNFFHELSSLELSRPKFSDNIKEYKALCDEFYSTQKRFVREYTHTYEVSNHFIEDINTELLYEWLNWLIIPVRNKKITLEEIPVNYFPDTIAIDDFNNDKLLNSKAFTLAFHYYIGNYFTQSTTYFQANELHKHINLINKKLTGNTYEYALMSALKVFNNNLLPENIKPLQFIIEKHRNKINHEEFVKVINDIERKLRLSYAKLPDSLSNINLTSLSGKNVKLGDLLKANKGTIVVLDIWASWCYWCFYDMEKAKDFKNDLVSHENVKWVYLSIDKHKDINKWKKLSKEKKELGLSENQYLIDENHLSVFSTFFDIDSGIPKYIIFNSKGDLVLPNGPRPTNNELFEKAIKQLKL